MIAAMETDSYWRTRCVGEAMDQGYTFLRLTCTCGRITEFPFPLLLRLSWRLLGLRSLHRAFRLGVAPRAHVADVIQFSGDWRGALGLHRLFAAGTSQGF
jgi:hypothetical protein